MTVSVTKRIKVRSLAFHDQPFRKLRNIKIEFADRLTLIAGHNGIGKSTILGLVANTFGITEKGPKSCIGEPFFANIERIVYLDLSEVGKAQEHPDAAPTVEAQVGDIVIKKRCAMTQRSMWKRARVVPRTIDKAQDDPVGQDAKVPLPTIYLGIKRLASIGEAEDEEVSSTKSTMHAEDKKLMIDFVRAVILGVQVTEDFTQQNIRGSKKKTTQPGYGNHDAFAVSMGQDSLASVATAIASFNLLKREMGASYPGGLLVIDELDVGFHPHAIECLVKVLKNLAKQLQLQIIATTHSPKLIEAIHPEGCGNSKSPDSVIYLVDTLHPRMAEDQSLAAILNDMALRQQDDRPLAGSPTLCVYFEDDEGMQFCDALLPISKRRVLGHKYGVRIKLVPLAVGGSNLLNLPRKDPIFKDRILVVDADTEIPQDAARRGNAVKLPCAKGSSGVNRSPENTIKSFLRRCTNEADGPFHQALLRFKITNPSSDRVSHTFFFGETGNNQRESSKRWWVSHWDALKRWRVIQEWAICHEEEAKAFEQAFEKAVSNTAERVKNKR